MRHGFSKPRERRWPFSPTVLKAIGALLLLGTTWGISEVRADESDRDPAAAHPLGGVVTVRRDGIDRDGAVRVLLQGETRVLRLPAAARFDAGNTFHFDGIRVKVKHLSRNTDSPRFDFGNRGRFLAQHPLYIQEQRLLSYADLKLFPVSEGQSALEAARHWIGDLDAFLLLHRNDPQVVNLVQSFVLNYSTNPPQGYLAGDHVWDTPRKIETWNQFFEIPMHYDLSGRALTVNGRPLTDGPLVLPKEQLGSVEPLHRKVLRNLRYTYEGFLTLLEEGGFSGDDSAYAEATCIRRAYLTVKMLEFGHELWQGLQERATD